MQPELHLCHLVTQNTAVQRNRAQSEEICKDTVCHVIRKPFLFLMSVITKIQSPKNHLVPDELLIIQAPCLHEPGSRLQTPYWTLLLIHPAWHFSGSCWLEWSCLHSTMSSPFSVTYPLTTVPSEVSWSKREHVRRRLEEDTEVKSSTVQLQRLSVCGKRQIIQTSSLCHKFTN